MASRATLIIGAAVMLTAFLAADAGDPAVADSARFIDVADDHMFGPAIEWMADQGITRGCNPPVNDRFCPDGVVTRGQMAAFLSRLMFYRDGVGSDAFIDDDSSIFEADIERLAHVGVTKGCNPPANDRFCPDGRVTRGQMAAFLVRALSLTDDGGGNAFSDDDGSVFESDIAKLAAAGITKGCNPPANDRFCPDGYVTRGQMATFMWRALGEPAVGSPGTNRFDSNVTFIPGSETIVDVSVGADGGDVVVFEFGAPLPKMGEIVAMSPTDEYPNGILGRAVEFPVGGGGATVVTEPVALQEAMPEVEYQFEGVVGDVAQVAGSSIRPSGLIEYDCGIPAFQPTIDVEFGTPDWTVEFAWGLGQATYAYISTKLPVTSSFHMPIPGSGLACEIEYEPFSIDLGTVPGPGGYPLDLDFEIEIELVASMDAGFEVALERYDFFEVGATYQDGHMQPIWVYAGRNTEDPTIVEPTLGGSIEFFPGAVLEASYRDRVGAEVKAGPSLSLAASVYDDPWWTLTAEPKAALDIEWDLWIFGGEFTVLSLTCCQVTLGQAEGPFPEPPEPDPLEITTAVLPNGIVAGAYAATLSAEGGVPPNSWSIDSGDLPAGLVLASDGSISGVPIAAGAYSFSVRVEDAVGTSTSKELDIAIDPAVFDDTRLPLEVTYRTLNSTDTAWSTPISSLGGHPSPLVDASQRALIVDEPTVKLLDSTGSALWTADLGSLWSVDTSLELAGFLSGGSVALVLDDDPSNSHDLHVAVISLDGSIVSDTEVVPGDSSDGSPRAPLLTSNDGTSVLFRTHHSFGPYDMYVVDLVEGSVVERRLLSSINRTLDSIEWRGQEVAFTSSDASIDTNLWVYDLASWNLLNNVRIVQGSSASRGDWSEDGRFYAWGRGDELPAGCSGLIAEERSWLGDIAWTRPFPFCFSSALAGLPDGGVVAWDWTSEDLHVYVIDDSGGLLVDGSIAAPTDVTWKWSEWALDESGHLVGIGYSSWSCDIPNRRPTCSESLVIEVDTATGQTVLSTLPRAEDRNPRTVGFANSHVYLAYFGTDPYVVEVMPSGLPLDVARPGGYWRK